MKNLNLFIAALLIIGLIAIFTSFKTDQKESTEYMTIDVDIFPDYEINISINGEYKQTKYKEIAKNKEWFNFNPVIKIIQDYEKEGWEVISNSFVFTGSVGGDPHNYFLLKRKK